MRITMNDHMPRSGTLVMKITSNNTVANSTPKPLLLAVCRCGWSMASPAPGKWPCFKTMTSFFLKEVVLPSFSTVTAASFRTSVPSGTMTMK